jgi:hypothetical protein
MCHSSGNGLLFVILAALSILYTPSAAGQTSGGIEQNFAGSLTATPTEALTALKPFFTVEVFITATDVRGGTGAKFVMDWAARGEIAEPAVEA